MICPYCGSDKVVISATKKKGMWYCRGCGKQFMNEGERKNG